MVEKVEAMRSRRWVRAAVTSASGEASMAVGSPFLRLASLLVGLAVALAAGLLFGPELWDVDRWSAESGPWAPLLFVLLFGVAALAFAPRPALSTIAGTLFALPVALPVVVAGTVLGAGLAFGIARVLGREAVAPRLRAGRLRKLDAMFARRGFTATVLCRLLPVLPYGVVNYGAGVTRVRPLPFLAGTAVGTFPANLAYVVVGNTLVAGETWRLVTWLALGLAALVVAGWLARELVVRRRAGSEDRVAQLSGPAGPGSAAAGHDVIAELPGPHT